LCCREREQQLAVVDKLLKFLSFSSLIQTGQALIFASLNDFLPPRFANKHGTKMHRPATLATNHCGAAMEASRRERVRSINEAKIQKQKCS
jgi:hypothetical protein